MKITDYNEIAQVASDLLPEIAPEFVAIVGAQTAVWSVMSIYLNNDLTKGYGQDFVVGDTYFIATGYRRVSVIAFENGVSVILDKASSRYQDNISLCGYEDLREDLHQIMLCIETAINRIQLR